MSEIKTYANRSNARRAAVAAGNLAEQVEITVHKSPQGTRFGWAANVEANRSTVGAANALPAKRSRVQRVEQNGVKRPAAGGICADVWGWLDANPEATVKALRETALAKRWNSNNATCEFYAWRKFNGIRGRASS
jgi:hypothetical protein